MEEMDSQQLPGLDVHEKLKRLVAIPSTTPPIDVNDMAKVLMRFGREYGADVTLQEVLPGKPNCILDFDFGQGKTLVFNTHMDVNNPQGQKWTHAPFVPEEINGRIYGCGACDAKGSLAAMLSAIENVLHEPKGISGKICLTAVMGEEAGGLGSLFLCEHGLKADGAIVGEPTELKLCVVHKGTYMRRVTFHGKAVHSARSGEGINAIHHAASFCVKYSSLQKQLNRNQHPILGPADASVTLISGGTRQNTIPETCEVVIDRRLLPGENHAQADRELDLMLRELREEIPEMKVDEETIVATVPSEVSTKEEIVQCALGSIDAVLGIKSSPQGFCGGCDMSKLVNISAVPTAIFGPGSMQQAHSPDEYIETDQLEKAVQIYEGIIRRFLAV